MFLWAGDQVSVTCASGGRDMFVRAPHGSSAADRNGARAMTDLTDAERAMLGGAQGDAVAMAMRIVLSAAGMRDRGQVRSGAVTTTFKRSAAGMPATSNASCTRSKGYTAGAMSPARLGSASRWSFATDSICRR